MTHSGQGDTAELLGNRLKHHGSLTHTHRAWKEGHCRRRVRNDLGSYACSLGDYPTRSKALSKNQTVQGSRIILQEDLVVSREDRTGHALRPCSMISGELLNRGASDVSQGNARHS